MLRKLFSISEKDKLRKRDGDREKLMDTTKYIRKNARKLAISDHRNEHPLFFLNSCFNAASLLFLSLLRYDLNQCIIPTVAT